MVEIVRGKMPLCPWQSADDNRVENNFVKREAWIRCRDDMLKAGYEVKPPRES